MFSALKAFTSWDIDHFAPITFKFGTVYPTLSPLIEAHYDTVYFLPLLVHVSQKLEKLDFINDEKSFMK